MKAKRRTILSVSHLIVFLLSLSFFGSFLGTGDSQANPCMQMVMGGTTGTAEPPAACTTQISPTDMETWDGTYFWAGQATTLVYTSTKFVAGKTTTVCKICLTLESSTGTSPTYNATVAIYNDTDGEPNEESIVDTSEVKNMTGVLTGDNQEICWTDISAAITNTNSYHVVLHTSTYDATNIMRWAKDSSCATEVTYRSTDGAEWTSTVGDPAKCAMVKLYEATP